MQNRALAQNPRPLKGSTLLVSKKTYLFVEEVLFFTSRKCTPL